MIKISTAMLLAVIFLSVGLFSKEAPEDPLELDMERASKFAAMAMRCIEKEYPNKPSLVMTGEKDIIGPRAQHPGFYGCFDWHSCVHGHWMLVRLLKVFPDLPGAPEIRKALGRNLTAENMRKEAEYFTRPDEKSFERTYGWAWLLKLAEELYTWEDEEGKTWLKNLAPLEEIIVKLYFDFFPKQTYAIRTGVHPNTAFGLAFALDYARAAKNKPLEDLIIERSNYYYQEDQDCPSDWEPGGEDFFSPCLIEAWLMKRILKRTDFANWFYSFLPQMRRGRGWNLIKPAMVTDRSDGKLVHLDGLNLSRAWCMKQIFEALPGNYRGREILLEAARKHAADALHNIHSGDYAGEHWLGSFATYLLTY